MAKQSKQPILVPVDFSPDSELALLKACELGECMLAPVVVLHVVHNPEILQGYYARFTKKKHLTRMEDVAGEMLDEFIRKVRKAHPHIELLKKIETLLVVGLPVTRILEVADKIRAAMVVMGSQGHTGLKYLMLGSKAEQVVRLCPLPVTIVKAGTKDQASSCVT